MKRASIQKRTKYTTILKTVKNEERIIKKEEDTHIIIYFILFYQDVCIINSQCKFVPPISRKN